MLSKKTKHANSCTHIPSLELEQSEKVARENAALLAENSKLEEVGYSHFHSLVGCWLHVVRFSRK